MKTKILWIAGLVLASFSCSGVLDVKPVSQIASSNFYKSASDAEAALVACYDGMQNSALYGNMIVIPEVVSDEALISQGGNNTRHQSFAPTPSQGNVGDVWRQAYFAIHRCVDVLRNVPGITDPALDKDRVLGEAHFVRALLYFNLVRLYGKLPLVTEPSKSPEQIFQLPRSEVSEVYDLIVSDLTEAERLLPAANTNRARAAKGAAQALLAKVYMTRNAAGDTEKALVELERVMADPQYSLLPGANFADLFTVGKQNTAETIFEVSYRPNAEQENHNLDRLTVPAQGNQYYLRPEPKMITLFAANLNDVRRAASVGEYDKKPYIKKYESGPPDVTTNRRVQDVNIVVLRLADVMLLRAEALNELGRTAEALPLLNQVRVRAGLAPTTAATQPEVKLAIENERLLELAFEGHRWFDLVRWNKAVGTIPNLTNPDRILWPIPAREIDLNPNLLPQNPSY